MELRCIGDGGGCNDLKYKEKTTDRWRPRVGCDRPCGYELEQLSARSFAASLTQGSSRGTDGGAGTARWMDPTVSRYAHGSKEGVM